MTTTQHTTALEAFNANIAQARQTLADLEKAIDNMERDFSASGARNWGYVGSMNYIAAKLTETMPV